MPSRFPTATAPSTTYALSGAPIEAAQMLLGCVIVIPAEDVIATITEVEAYGGPADQRYPDPAAHCFMGQPTATRHASPSGAVDIYPPMASTFMPTSRALRTARAGSASPFRSH